MFQETSCCAKKALPYLSPWRSWGLRRFSVPVLLTAPSWLGFRGHHKELTQKSSEAWSPTPASASSGKAFGQRSRGRNPAIIVAEPVNRDLNRLFTDRSVGPIWEQIGNRTGDVSPMRLQYAQIEAVS